VTLTMMLAETINNTNKGEFKNVDFNEDEMEELRLAAWMHDVGKITTPEYVVDKSTKLQTIFDRISLIETRFQVIAQLIEDRHLSGKVELMQNGKTNESGIKQLNKELAGNIKLLQEELNFIKKCNNPGEFLSDDKIEKIKEIANKTYSFGNMNYQYLTKDEVENLCIQKGSLTKEERKIIENHATMTLKMLNELPFPPKLANVPEYAAGHHEKLDGSGYPRGLTEKEMSLQSRIMAVADIFEALTARDRPYKKPMKLSQAVKIMGFMKKDRHIDPNIYDLFMESRLFYDYAKREMNPDQIDI
ncbi:MAG: HD domain-containing phosphohydrolase, partial [Thermodesulfobacteriota bacterium]|nr:HD domain-containing phosphohydrolase [Thermodesulfobacteriota bacterium]